MKKSYEMVVTKITKGAIRYSDEEGIHSFYLRKEEVGEPVPKKIIVTIGVIEEV